MIPGIPRWIRTGALGAALAAVAAASLLDGDAADLVADGDGEWFLLHSQTAPSVSAATDPAPVRPVRRAQAGPRSTGNAVPIPFSADAIPERTPLFGRQPGPPRRSQSRLSRAPPLA